MARHLYQYALIAAFGLILISTAPAKAQWAVTDGPLLEATTKQINTLKRQLEAVKDQLKQMEALNGAIGESGPIQRPSFFKTGQLYSSRLEQLATPVLEQVLKSQGLELPSSGKVFDNRGFYMSALTLNDSPTSNTRTVGMKPTHSVRRARQDMMMMSAINGLSVARTSQENIPAALAQAEELSAKVATETHQQERFKVMTEAISAMIAEQANTRSVNSALLELMAHDVLSRSPISINVAEE